MANEELKQQLEKLKEEKKEEVERTQLEKQISELNQSKGKKVLKSLLPRKQDVKSMGRFYGGMFKGLGKGIIKGIEVLEKSDARIREQQIKEAGLKKKAGIKDKPNDNKDPYGFHTLE